jgi:transcriptional regulator with XRE-family HTH domain
MTPKTKFTQLRDGLYERNPESRERVAAKAVQLEEQLGLAELRALRERTQAQLADVIGTTQSGVSRLERQQDLMVSTLYDYVAATGGVLRLVAQYPDFECEIDLPLIRSRRELRAASPRDFRVVWQNLDTRKFVHVGWLRFTGTAFVYQYTAEAHLDADFEPFPAFPDLHATYESADLFAYFAERVPSTAVDRSLPAALGLREDEATPVELLARSWGRSPHDTIQVVPEPSESSDGASSRFFLASGVSHVDERDPDAVANRIARLRRNDPLALRDEPDNPINVKAILLEASGEIVGWMPDYLLDEAHKSRDAGDDLKVFVEHANGPEVPWHLRLLCRLETQSRD